MPGSASSALGVEPRDPLRVEAGEGAPVALALVQDRRPRQPGLRALEHEHLEEVARVARGDAPLLVVVGDVELVRPPEPTRTARAHQSGRAAPAGGPSAWFVRPRGLTPRFARSRAHAWPHASSSRSAPGRGHRGRSRPAGRRSAATGRCSPGCPGNWPRCPTTSHRCRPSCTNGRHRRPHPRPDRPPGR